MKATKVRSIFGAAALAVGLFASVAATRPELRHFALKKSAPEADATLTQAPSEVRLWFSEAPEEGTTSIHVMRAEGAMVPTGDVTGSTEDGAVFSVAFKDALEPGSYMVMWRGMGDDGHVVKGSFNFKVETP